MNTDEFCLAAIPSPARMYDYYLGGKDNYAVDRQAAEKALSVVPHGRQVAGANRAFLIRAVTLMAERGVCQFIDLGTGFPTPDHSRGWMTGSGWRLSRCAVGDFRVWV